MSRDSEQRREAMQKALDQTVEGFINLLVRTNSGPLQQPIAVLYRWTETEVQSCVEEGDARLSPLEWMQELKQKIRREYPAAIIIFATSILVPRGDNPRLGSEPEIYLLVYREVDNDYRIDLYRPNSKPNSGGKLTNFVLKETLDKDTLDAEKDSDVLGMVGILRDASESQN